MKRRPSAGSVFGIEKEVPISAIVTGKGLVSCHKWPSYLNHTVIMRLTKHLEEPQQSNRDLIEHVLTSRLKKIPSSEKVIENEFFQEESLKQ